MVFMLFFFRYTSLAVRSNVIIELEIFHQYEIQITVIELIILYVATKQNISLVNLIPIRFVCCMAPGF